MTGDILVTAQQMKELDSKATSQYGIPSILLMENAGRSVAEVADTMLDDAEGAIVTIIAGPGNNGGDGFVAARHLHNMGAKVAIAYYGEEIGGQGDAAINRDIAQKMKLDIIQNPSKDDLLSLLSKSDLVIDALLGTGIKGNVRPTQSEIISIINECCSPVLSVDIPSGIDADTGNICGNSVMADVTITFALPKIGLVNYPGAMFVGELMVADIGIPKELLLKSGSNCFIVNKEIVGFALPERLPDAHKGCYGKVAIVAGSVGLTGAAVLAAEGALRMGAGLVTVACPESLNDILEAKLTEQMTFPVPECSHRAFGNASIEKVKQFIGERDSVVLGPGVGRNMETVEFILNLIESLEKPAIIDADGLYAIASDLDVLKKAKAPIIITPHPGEMAMLVGTGIDYIQSNRLEIAVNFAKENNVIVILKGAGTIIASPDGDTFINPTGCPGMATGGTGDVLSGMIGALLARGIYPVNASCSAVYLHGLAGQIASEVFGEESIKAGDVADYISDAIKFVVDESKCKGVNDD